MKQSVAFLLKLFMSGTLLAATVWTQTESGWKIDTIVGTGKPGHGGDGGRAVEAQLDFPWGVAVDNAGNVYIAEHYSQRIRRVDPGGTIDTIAGTGEPSYGGDGGPAVKAPLFFPSGVVADHAGSLYIADTGNHRIRRVDASGIITTIAGTGESGFDWDGPAVEARLRRPSRVAVDGLGNLYIAGKGDFGIRRVDATGTMSKVGGSGIHHGGPSDQERHTRDRGIAVDRSGNLYIANIDNNNVRRVDATETVSITAGTGEPGYGRDGVPEVEAQLNYPAGVAVDKSGNLYIADTGNHRILRVDTSGTITTIAGTGEPGYGGDGGPASEAQLASPIAVAVDSSGKLYIADLGNYRIRILTPPPRLDFAHFANGASITSDLVLVNVGTTPIRPTIYFYDPDGHLIDAASVVHVMGDLEVVADGALTVGKAIEPLGELTISTTGEGVVVSGSVIVVADGPIGGGPALQCHGDWRRGSGIQPTCPGRHLSSAPQSGRNQHRRGDPEPGR